MEFYTYIYHDPSRGNEPFYVGKGQKDRAWKHLVRKDKHPVTHRIQQMKSNGVEPVIGLYAGFDEELALLVEEELIAKFGRKDLGKGPLLNLTDGGAAGGTRNGRTNSETQKAAVRKYMSERVVSEETKRKISFAKKGKPSEKRGSTLTENQRAKISKSMKGKITFTDEMKVERSKQTKAGFDRRTEEQKAAFREKCRLAWQKRKGEHLC